MNAHVTPQQIAAYRESGFHLQRDFLTAAELAKWRETLLPDDGANSGGPRTDLMGTSTFTRATPSGTNGQGAGPTQHQIAKKAYEIWEKRGRLTGQCVQNWREAEAELRKSTKSRFDRQAA